MIKRFIYNSEKVLMCVENDTTTYTNENIKILVDTIENALLVFKILKIDYSEISELITLE